MTEQQIHELLTDVSAIENSLEKMETRQQTDAIAIQDMRNELTTLSNVNFSLLCLLALFAGSYIGMQILSVIRKIWGGNRK